MVSHIEMDKVIRYQYLWFHSDEERRVMYDCHPQLSHQLPFDQGVQIVISPSLEPFIELVSKELNHFWVIAGLFRHFFSRLEI